MPQPSGGGRDQAEVAAVKSAGELELPVFVISEAPPSGQRRRVQLGWVSDSDDLTRTFLIELGDSPTQSAVGIESTPDAPFTPIGNRPKTRRDIERAVRDPRFKFRVTKAHKGRCALSGIAVPEMLEAAHIITVEAGGTDDPWNGLLLTAGLHRAFDAGLWAIDPESLDVVARDRGPTLADMGITRSSLVGYRPAVPRTALEWRFAKFRSTATP